MTSGDDDVVVIFQTASDSWTVSRSSSSGCTGCRKLYLCWVLLLHNSRCGFFQVDKKPKAEERFSQFCFSEAQLAKRRKTWCPSLNADRRFYSTAKKVRNLLETIRFCVVQCTNLHTLFLFFLSSLLFQHRWVWREFGGIVFFLSQMYAGYFEHVGRDCTALYWNEICVENVHNICEKMRKLIWERVSESIEEQVIRQSTIYSTLFCAALFADWLTSNTWKKN